MEEMAESTRRMLTGNLIKEVIKSTGVIRSTAMSYIISYRSYDLYNLGSVSIKYMIYLTFSIADLCVLNFKLTLNKLIKL